MAGRAASRRPGRARRGRGGGPASSSAATCAQPLVGQVRGGVVTEVGEPRTFGQGLPGAVLAAQQALGEGEVGQERQAVAVALVEDPVVSGARARMLYWFCTLTKRGRPAGGGSGRLLEHRRAEVGAAELAHLAFGDELAEDARSSRRWGCSGPARAAGRGRCGRCPSRVQAVLDRPAHVGGRGSALVAFVGPAELGGQHDVVASRARARPQVGLALGAAVDVGSVEEGDAGIECGADDRRGLVRGRRGRRNCCSPARRRSPRGTRSCAFPSATSSFVAPWSLFGIRRRPRRGAGSTVPAGSG